MPFFASGRPQQKFLFLFGLFLWIVAVCLCRHLDTWARSSDFHRELSAAQAFIRIYPDGGFVLEQDNWGLYLRVGSKRLLFSPVGGCPQPCPEAAQDQPLCASLGLDYPVGVAGRDAPTGFDPGRVRNEAVFKILYGENAVEVQQNCVPVVFMGETVLFNRQHGAAAALERVGRTLEALVRHSPAMRDYISPMEGTFLWRTIEGTDRLSAHSFAIAIDLNAKSGPYWRWKNSPSAVQNARQHYPQAIVDAFESEGFIWGGKWHSFDFMHFEYRPELFVRRRD